jgi:uncharacterized membrane protein YsdA (DUF1294 family)
MSSECADPNSVHPHRAGQPASGNMAQRTFESQVLMIALAMSSFGTFVGLRPVHSKTHTHHENHQLEIL